jgi:sarcosine oxidase subunit gamma
MVDVELAMRVAATRSAPEAVLLVSAHRGTTGGGEALATALGCALPAASRWTAGAGVHLVSAGIDRWFVVGQGEAEPALVERIEAAVGDRAAVIDLTHAREVFGLSGDGARIVLSKGCTADLRPASFGAGGAMVTAIGKIGVTIIAHEGERFDIHVPSSYADFFAEWLEAAGGAFS